MSRDNELFSPTNIEDNKFKIDKKEIAIHDIWLFLDRHSKGYLLKDEIPLINYCKNKKNSIISPIKTIPLPFSNDLFLSKFQLRNGQQILNMEDFKEIISNNFTDYQVLKDLRFRIYKNYFRYIPGCIARFLLWIRISSAVSDLVKTKSSADIEEKNYINAIMTMANSWIEAVDYVSDVVLLVQIYDYSQRPSNINHNWGYTLLFTIRLLAILSHYFIAYSSGIQLLLNKGYYEPSNFRKKNFFVKILLSFFFTFVSPIYFMFLTIFNLFYKCAQASLIIFVPIRKGYFQIVSKLDGVIFAMGLEMSEYDGFLEQKSIGQLMFQDLTVLIFDTLMIAQVIYAPGVIQESYYELVVSYVSTIMNIFSTFFMLKIKADYLKEDFLTYCLISMKAKFGWVPFLQKIKDELLTDKIIDFHLIKCPIPLFTPLVGMYQYLKYDFSEITVKKLADAVANLELAHSKTKTDKLQNIKIGRCLHRISIQSIGVLLKAASSNAILIDLEGLDYQENIDWTKKNGLIFLDPSKGGKWNANTLLNESLLIICFQTEINEKDFKYKKFAELLLKENAYPDSFDIYGETPLLYTIKKQKLQSMELLLKYGANPNLKNLNGTDSPLSAAINILENKVFIVKLIEGKADPHQTHKDNYSIFGVMLQTIKDDCIKRDKTAKKLDNLDAFREKDIKAVTDNEKLILLEAVIASELRQLNYHLKDFMPQDSDISSLKDSDENNFYHLSLPHIQEGTSSNLTEFKNFELFKAKNKFGETPLSYSLRLGKYFGIKYVLSDPILKKYAKDVDLNDEVFNTNFNGYMKQKIIEWKNSHVRSIINLLDNSVQNELHARMDKENETITQLRNAEHLKKQQEADKINKINNPLNISNQVSHSKDKEEESIWILELQKQASQMNEKVQLQQTPKKRKNKLKQKVFNKDGLILRRINFVETLIYIVLEATSLMDLITDIIILIALFEYGHTLWAALSILTMITPYFISYAPLITLFMERGVFEKSKDENGKSNNFSIFIINIFGIFFITPLCLIYFFGLDVVYVVTTLTIYTYHLFCYIITFGNATRGLTAEILDKFFQKTFNLNNMDVRGVRRLRTINQIIFESIPQIILQAWILSSNEKGLDINISALGVSIATAIFHLIVEFLLIYLESGAVKSTLMNYSITCLNGRLNWIPFIERFAKSRDPNDYVRNYLYDKIEYSVCGKKFNMNYEFYNSTIEVLAQAVAFVPSVTNIQNEIEIKLGSTCTFVDLNRILLLIAMAKNKIKLDLKGLEWPNIIFNTFQKNIPMNPIGPDGENVLATLAKVGAYEGLQIFLEKDINPNIMVKVDPEKPEVNLVNLAIHCEDHQVLKVLLKSKAPIQQAYEFKNQCHRVINIDKLKLLEVFLESNRVYLNRAHQNDVFNIVIDLIEKKDNKIDALKILNLIGGFDYQVEGTITIDNKAKMNELKKLLEFYNEYKPQISEDIWIQFKDNRIGCFKTSIIQKMKLLRGELPGEKPLGMKNDIALGSKISPYDLEEFGIESKYFLQLYFTLLNSKVPDGVKPEEIDEMDKLVEKIGLDESIFHQYFLGTESSREIQTYTLKYNKKTSVGANEGKPNNPNVVDFEWNAQYKLLQSITLKDIDAIKDFHFKGTVGDQGWGNSGLSGLLIYVVTNCNAYVNEIKIINRDLGDISGGKYDLMFDGQKLNLDILHMPMSEAKIEVYLKCPPYAGWTAETNGYEIEINAYKKKCINVKGISNEPIIIQDEC